VLIAAKIAQFRFNNNAVLRVCQAGEKTKIHHLFFKHPEKEDGGRGNRLFCPYLDTRGFFVKVGARSPRPQMMIIEC
jgi:hypothetical protein